MSLLYTLPPAPHPTLSRRKEPGRIRLPFPRASHRAPQGRGAQPGLSEALVPPTLPSCTRPTYGVAFRTLQFEVAVELVRGRALALHLLAEVEGAAPGSIFPAVDDVAPPALRTTETQSD